MTPSRETSSSRNLRRRALFWSAGIGLALLAPLVGMRFCDEIKWTASDFLFAGALLLTGAVVLELTALGRDAYYRAGTRVALGAALLLLWLDGAVGVIGDGDNPSRLLHLALLGAGCVSAIAARFRAGAMARIFAGLACGQVLIVGSALVLDWGAGGARWPYDAIALGGGFAGAWFIAAALFRASHSGGIEER